MTEHLTIIETREVSDSNCVTEICFKNQGRACNTFDQSQKDNLRERITIALDAGQQRLDDVLHEYSYWNEAHQNLIVNPDQKWIDVNTGLHLFRNYEITFSIAINADMTPSVEIFEGQSYKFVVMLPESTEKQAVFAAERLRMRVEKLAIEHDANTVIQCTITIGLVHRKSEESVDSLRSRADAALYIAKSSGGNLCYTAA